MDLRKPEKEPSIDANPSVRKETVVISAETNGTGNRNKVPVKLRGHEGSHVARLTDRQKMEIPTARRGAGAPSPPHRQHGGPGSSSLPTRWKYLKSSSS